MAAPCSRQPTTGRSRSCGASIHRRVVDGFRLFRGVRCARRRVTPPSCRSAVPTVRVATPLGRRCPQGQSAAGETGQTARPAQPQQHHLRMPQDWLPGCWISDRFFAGVSRRRTSPPESPRRSLRSCAPGSVIRTTRHATRRFHCPAQSQPVGHTPACRAPDRMPWPGQAGQPMQSRAIAANAHRAGHCPAPYSPCTSLHRTGPGLPASSRWSISSALLRSRPTGPAALMPNLHCRAFDRMTDVLD